ncbi:MAG: aldo/keto reductase [Rhizobacter sp.]|nr:aldo/keto reductase [Burkholderiales bacterium]
MTTRTPSTDTAMPRFGIGTWRMGEQSSAAQAEIALITAAIERGVTLIDTAEMYGDGGAERVIARAIANAPAAREKLFIVSKVYPHNASRNGTIAACERSLKRLGADYLDCYLLHWPGEHPIAETVHAFETLKAQGKIRAWGVSNFDLADMQQLITTPNGNNVATNQVLYNLSCRGVEFSLLSWQRDHAISTMAYSPIAQAELVKSSKLIAIASDIGATPAQVAMAWLLTQPDVIVIPKTTHLARLEENLGALNLTLDASTLAALDSAFPKPSKRTPLAML